MYLFTYVFMHLSMALSIFYLFIHSCIYSSIYVYIYYFFCYVCMYMYIYIHNISLHMYCMYVSLRNPQTSPWFFRCNPHLLVLWVPLGPRTRSRRTRGPAPGNRPLHGWASQYLEDHQKRIIPLVNVFLGITGVSSPTKKIG